MADSHAEWLLSIALAPGDAPKMIPLGELVQRGLAEVEDVAELRAAGLVLYEFPNLPPSAPRVWVESRSFVLACAVVVEQRELAEPRLVH